MQNATIEIYVIIPIITHEANNDNEANLISAKSYRLIQQKMWDVYLCYYAQSIKIHLKKS